MKVKLEDIVNSQAAAMHLAQMKLPVRTAYWLQKNLRKIDSELREFFAVRLRLARELGVEEKDGTFKFEDDARKEFNEKIQELLDVEVELDIQPMAIETLGDAQVTVADLMLCSYLFTEMDGGQTDTKG